MKRGDLPVRTIGNRHLLVPHTVRDWYANQK